MIKQTNLCNIVQNRDEWVVVLGSRCDASLFIISLILHTFGASETRVIGEGFCCCPDRSNLEEDSLCSEFPDENALIQRWGVL